MDRAEYERSYRLEDWHWWFVSQRRLVATVIEQWVRPDDNSCILDVGCGTGAAMMLMQQWGNPLGIDLNPLPLALARQRQALPLAQASVLTLPYPDNTFNLVTAFDLLYHQWVSDDTWAIAELYRVLQPGGWLIVTDSALPILWSPHDEIYFARQRYTLFCLREKLSRAGFRLQLCSYVSSLLLPVLFMVRLIIRWSPLPNEIDLHPLPGWLNQLLIAIRDLEAKWLLRNHTLPAGSSVFCLVQKPTAKAEPEKVTSLEGSYETS